MINCNKAFALKLSKIMLEKNISRYWLQKHSGLSYTALTNIFNEENRDVRFSTIAKVCQTLSVSLSEFFSDPIFDFDNLDLD